MSGDFLELDLRFDPSSSLCEEEVLRRVLLDDFEEDLFREDLSALLTTLSRAISLSGVSFLTATRLIFEKETSHNK